jgi:hypothetical protein
MAAPGRGMKNLFAELFGKYGLRAIAGILVFGAVVWALAHFAAAPGQPIEVLFGLVHYTKAPPSSAEPPPAGVVPKPDVRPVDELPEARSPLDVLKDISVFDLRAWRPVPAEGQAGRISPANYINYLHVRKNRDADTLVAHYQTGGYAIDIRCITHKFDVSRKEQPTEHAEGHEYAIEVDVSQEPLGSEFLIVIEATYWNGFRDVMQEAASTYTDDDIADLGELALVVLFPPSKPFKQVRRFESDSKGMTPYRGVDSFYEDVNRGFVYWSIRQRRPDWHYMLEWDW